MNIRLMLILFVCVLSATIQAQDTQITVENAASLQPLYAVGSALPGKLAFSPDDRYLVASTTDETYVYRTDDLKAAPHILPITDSFTFDDEGILVADGQRWNLDTGLSIGISPAINILPATPEQPTTIVEIVKTGGQTILLDTQMDLEVREVAISDDYRSLAIAAYSKSMTSNISTISVYLFELPSNRLIAAIPQALPTLNRMFFQQGSSSLYVVSSNGNTGTYRTKIYQGQNGVQLYSNGISDAQISPNRNIVGYLTDNNYLSIRSVDDDALIPVEEWDDFYSQRPFALSTTQAAIYYDDEIEVWKLFPKVRNNELAFKIPNSQVLRSLSFSADGNWLIGKYDGVYLQWNLNAPNDPPISLAGENIYLPVVNPEATRYLDYNPNNATVIIGDIATPEILAAVPKSAKSNSDYSQLAYWSKGNLIVQDVLNKVETTLNVLPTYIGTIAEYHTQSAQVATYGNAAQVINVTTDARLQLELPSLPNVIDFNRDGSQVLAYGSGEEIVDLTPFVVMRDTTTGKVITEKLDNIHYAQWHLSNTGKYLVDTGSYCGSPYGIPTMRVHPFNTTSFSTPLVSVEGACGDDAYALSSSDDMIFVGSYQRLHRIPVDTLTEPLSIKTNYEETQSLYAILDYKEDLEPYFEEIEGVELSPDEQLIALTIGRWSQNESAPKISTRVEIFALSDLEIGTKRRDVRPAQIVENATSVMFSPDSQTVVTNAGLFTIQYANETGVVDGTISAFTPDSELLATYQEGYVTLWKVAQPNANTVSIAQFAVNDVNELGFSPDGTKLYIVRDGEVQVWSVE